MKVCAQTETLEFKCSAEMAERLDKMKQDYESRTSHLVEKYNQLTKQKTNDDARRQQNLANLLVQTKEILIHAAKYETFKDVTKTIRDLERNIRNSLECDMDLGHSRESKCDSETVDDADITHQCLKCTERVLWMSCQGVTRFSDIIQIKDGEQECLHCGQLIQWTGSLGEQQLVVGIHVNHLWKRNRIDFKQCGLVCSCCAGKKVCCFIVMLQRIVVCHRIMGLFQRLKNVSY